MYKKVIKESNMEKRGVSPIIATVLLIVMVVVIASIVFLWIRGMTQETITKFGGTNINLICNDVKFDASYSDGMLYLSNVGNVPIFGMKLKLYKGGSFETKDLKDNPAWGWPDYGLNQGGTFSASLGSVISGNDKIVLIPVLIGNSDKGKKTMMCNEKQNGVEITVA